MAPLLAGTDKLINKYERDFKMNQKLTDHDKLHNIRVVLSKKLKEMRDKSLSNFFRELLLGAPEDKFDWYGTAILLKKHFPELTIEINQILEG